MLTFKLTSSKPYFTHSFISQQLTVTVKINEYILPYYNMNDDFYNSGIDWGAVDFALPESEPRRQQQDKQKLHVQQDGHDEYQQQQQQQNQHEQVQVVDNNNTGSNEISVLSPTEFHLQQQVSSHQHGTISAPGA